jgi:hypothetical protein
VAQHEFEEADEMARTAKAIDETQETQLVDFDPDRVELEPGDICPCCGRKVPAAKQTTEEQKAKRREYNQRPEVKERQKAYHKARREKIAEALKLLDAQQEDETPDEDEEAEDEE